MPIDLPPDVDAAEEPTSEYEFVLTGREEISKEEFDRGLQTIEETWAQLQKEIEDHMETGEYKQARDKLRSAD
mgnify:FL=1